MEVLIITGVAAVFSGGLGYAIGRTGRSGRADMEAADARWEAMVLQDAVRRCAPEAWPDIRADVQAHTRGRSRPA